MNRAAVIIIGTYLCCVNIIHAETQYVIDELQVGVHKDSSIDSPILTLVPSGTALQVLSKNDVFVQVTEPGGTTGWVHEQYLIKEAPDNTQLLALKKQNQSLENELQQLKLQSTGNAEIGGNTQQLERQLKSERLRVGELQAQLADIKSKIPAGTDATLRKEVEQLRKANEELVRQQALAEKPDDQSLSNVVPTTDNWKMIMMLISIAFIIGILLGVYFLDFLNRRRHGGFRV